MAIDRRFFFDSVRPLFGGSLRQSQVDGMNAILDGWERRAPDGDRRWLAYMLATAFHETARTMQPVREAYWLSEQWRRTHLRYYPYYGRGYVQLTWRENYARAGTYVGADLVGNPDLAMNAAHAAIIMFAGMEEGWFRGDRHGRQTLARYFNRTVNDPVGAREIINGREWKTIGGRPVLLATVIAQHYDTFLRAVAPSPLAVAGGATLEGAFGRPTAMFEEQGVSEPLDFSIAEPVPSLAPEAAAAELYGVVPDASLVVDRTVDIVTAYVGCNTIPHQDVPDFIAAVHAALQGLQAAPLDYYPKDWTAPDVAGDAGNGASKQRKGRGGRPRRKASASKASPEG